MQIHPDTPHFLDLFVHVPKTGGTSLRSAIINHYGPTNVWIYRDIDGELYPQSDGLFNTGTEEEHAAKRRMGSLSASEIKAIMEMERRNATPQDIAVRDAKAIVGHLSLDGLHKLTSTRKTHAFTVVRDPLMRMVSHYRYVQQCRGQHPLTLGWQKDHNPDLPFTTFALGENVRNFQTTYTGSDPSRYEYIGITENMSEFMQAIGLVETGAAIPVLRKTTVPMLGAQELDDPGFQRAFQEFHSLDYDFYAAALARQRTDRSSGS
jgi:hypothetical protein